jgi:hypothetical protein
LAELARQNIEKDQINKILKTAKPKSVPTEEQIESELSKATQEALKAITTKGYHGIINRMANEIIYLGMAIYGNGTQIKSQFGQK